MRFAFVTSLDVVSAGKKYTLSQQIELGPAEHLALYQLQPVDIAFHGSGTPVDGEASMHSLPITVEIPTEATELRRARALNIGYPVCELGPTSLADQDHETLRQSPARRQLTAAPTKIGELHTFGIVKLAAAAQEQPAQRLWPRQDAPDGWWWFRLAPIFHESSHRSLAAAIPECLEFSMQKRCDVTTVLPTAHEVRSESIQATRAFSGRPA